MIVKIKLMNSRAMLPSGRIGDAGYDVHATQDEYIQMGQTMRLALGFGLEIPDGYMGLLLPRSGHALSGHVVSSPPIDESYRGEVHAICHNLGKTWWFIKAGDRIAQLVIVPALAIEWDTFSELSETVRGSSGFGSTGRGVRVPGNSG